MTLAVWIASRVPDRQAVEIHIRIAFMHRFGVMKDGRIVEELDRAALRDGRATDPFTRDLIAESGPA